MGLLPLREETIEGLEAARVAIGYDEMDMYRVELSTADGVVPLTTSYSSARRPKEESAAQINAYIGGGSQETLEVVGDTGIIRVVAGGLCLVIGLTAAIGTATRQ
jgi:hypothetical protein